MILKIETDHCPMCKMADRLLEKHGVEYVKVDADDRPDLLETYAVRSVPCLFYIEDGRETIVCRTPQSEKSLVDFLNTIGYES